jgi:hypothetical protein
MALKPVVSMAVKGLLGPPTRHGRTGHGNPTPRGAFL